MVEKEPARFKPASKKAPALDQRRRLMCFLWTKRPNGLKRPWRTVINCETIVSPGIKPLVKAVFRIKD